MMDQTKVKITYPERGGDVVKYTTVESFKQWLLDGGDDPNWVEGIIGLLKTQRQISFRGVLYELEEGEV